MPQRWKPSLEDYVDMAAYLLRADRAAIAALPRIALAESALHGFWMPTAWHGDRRDADTDADLVERFAAGAATHEEVLDWIRERTHQKRGRAAIHL